VDSRKPGWLYLNFSHEPSSHDIRKTTEHSAHHLSTMILEGLMKINSEGIIEPAQAERVDVSNNGLTYTFHLRNCFWSDGTPVTAQDFASSWLSCLHPQTPSPNAYFFFCIKNAKAAHQGLVSLDQVGIEVPNEKCLVVHLKYPINYFLEIMASPFASPIKYTPQASDYSSLLCNGPFKIQRWVHAQEIRLVKNPHYRCKDAIKLQGIRISLVNEESTLIALFQDHQLDMIGPPFCHISQSIQNGVFKPDNAYTLQGTLVSVCNFNTEKFPLNNIHFRKALAYAIEKEQLVDSMHMFHTRAAYSLLPETFIQHLHPAFRFCDSENAKECLKLALEELNIQQDQLPKLKLTYPLSKEHDAIKNIVQILQHQWKQHLDLDIDLEALEIQQVTAKLGQRDYDIGFVSWAASYPSPFCYFERFLSKDTKKNYTGWENPQFISLIQNATNSTDNNSQAKYFLDAEKILASDMPITPLIFWDYCLITSNRVKGLKLCKTGNLCLESLDITPPKN